MCDSGAKLSPLALLQLEEDAVTELMGDLHIDGLTAMREYNAMWVFVKNTVPGFHRPAWREEYELRSFVPVIPVTVKHIVPIIVKAIAGLFMPA